MYSPEEIKEIQKFIVENVSKGKSLHWLIENDEDMFLPSHPTIYSWLNPEHKKYDAEFSTDYAQARDIRAEKMFEEMLEIADADDDNTYIDKMGNRRIDWGKVQRNKTQIDTRKWVLSRMKPKKYGDKIETTVQGGDKPIEISFED